MEADATRICTILLGLPEGNVIGVENHPSEPLAVYIECTSSATDCPQCGHPAWMKDRSLVELTDLPAFG